jgi:sporulation protein YlmC with PRC-barrel domain
LGPAERLAFSLENHMTGAFIGKTLVVATAAGAIAAASAQAPEQPRGGAPTVSSSQIIGAQGADEWLASQLRGATVIGSDNQRIGEVVDVLLDSNGRARAYIVGEGGLMGLGDKEIAIELSQFHDEPAAEGGKARLKVPMTKDQLAIVPAFRPLPSADAAAGSAPR